MSGDDLTPNAVESTNKRSIHEEEAIEFDDGEEIPRKRPYTSNQMYKFRVGGASKIPTSEQLAASINVGDSIKIVTKNFPKSVSKIYLIFETYRDRGHYNSSIQIMMKNPLYMSEDIYVIVSAVTRYVRKSKRDRIVIRADIVGQFLHVIEKKFVAAVADDGQGANLSTNMNVPSVPANMNVLSVPANMNVPSVPANTRTANTNADANSYESMLQLWNSELLTTLAGQIADFSKQYSDDPWTQAMVHSIATRLTPVIMDEVVAAHMSTVTKAMFEHTPFRQKIMETLINSDQLINLAVDELVEDQEFRKLAVKRSRVLAAADLIDSGGDDVLRIVRGAIE
jgi:hypothetical protein